ncbi:ATP-binding protein [Trichothermofontia sp.]
MIALLPRSVSQRQSTISFASTLYLSPILDLLLAEVPPAWQLELRLGLQEALVNAAKHGNCLDPDKQVCVQFFIFEDQYWWIITDQGRGFCPEAKCRCERAPEIADREMTEDPGECGRGLYIMYQIFDQVYWNAQGTELRLCKRVNGKPLF